uniref:Uncharacterized protein n=1 Tax=Tanacetum cinerariifolium TaxID=118510 RepID=A0A6L2JEQ1_TANCI|nr:hypothetical protein [Tanacetum cinerariifolium]
MMIQAPKKVGKGSAVPTETHHTPIVTQPSSSQPQKKQKSRRKQRMETEVPHSEPQKESVPTPSNDLLHSGEDRMQLTELMNLCTNLQKQVLDLEKAKIAQAKKIADLKKRVKKLERKKKSRTSGLKRLYKIGLSARIFPLMKKGRINEEDMFRVHDLDGDEVIVDVTAGENVEQDATVAEKEGKRSYSQESSEFRTTSSLQSSKLLHAKDKGKGIMVEPEKPLKKKDQIAIDKEIARKLEAHMKAKMEEDERIAREKVEANILQTKEQEKLTNAEKARMFMEFLEKRWKFFARKREIEKRNRPPTKAQQRNLMCTYLKNMDGWKLKNLKKKSFDEIQKLFGLAMKKVNTSVDMNTEIVKERSKKTQAGVTEGSSKRAGEELEQESAKKQKLDKLVEAEVDNAQREAEMKMYMKIIPDDEIPIDAFPFATKPSNIVD